MEGPFRPNCMEEWLGLLTTRLNQPRSDLALWWIGRMKASVVISERVPNVWFTGDQPSTEREAMRSESWSSRDSKLVLFERRLRK